MQTWGNWQETVVRGKFSSWAIFWRMLERFGPTHAAKDPQPNGGMSDWKLLTVTKCHMKNDLNGPWKTTTTSIPGTAGTYHGHAALTFGGDSWAFVFILGIIEREMEGFSWCDRELLCNLSDYYCSTVYAVAHALHTDTYTQRTKP